MKKDNTCVSAVLMLNENRNTMIFNMLGSVVYCIMDNYLCVYYFCLKQDQLTLAHKIFWNKTFNDISGTETTALLMNIMSCHGFFEQK